MTKVIKYSRRIIWIHWVSSLLIIALIMSGIMMEGEPILAKKLQLY